MSNPTVAMTRNEDVVYVPAELQKTFERDGYTVVAPTATAKKENS